MTTTAPPLPSPSANQPYFNVSALEAGLLTAPERLFIAAPSHPDNKRVMPALSFFLRHSATRKNVLFDLGIRKDWENLPPKGKERIEKVFSPCTGRDVGKLLESGGVKAEDVDMVILSHLHWDHIGDGTAFTRAEFILGGPSKVHLDNSYPGVSSSTVPADVVPHNRTKLLYYDQWTPVGPFQRGHDLFGDGSLYLIDSTGHMDGHINALVRINGNGDWIYLAGDSAHDNRLLSGEQQIAVLADPEKNGGILCMHARKEVAEEHIKRIRVLKDHYEGRVKVILAHDVEWYEENKTNLYPNTITCNA